MNKQIFEGGWREVKAKLKEKWSELTEDDLNKIKANNDEIYAILERYYGYAKDEAKEAVKEFINQSKMPIPGFNVIADMSIKAWSLVREKVRENPVKSFFIALSAIAVARRLIRSNHRH